MLIKRYLSDLSVGLCKDNLHKVENKMSEFGAYIRLKIQFRPNNDACPKLKYV